MRRGDLMLGTTVAGEPARLSAEERALHMHVIGGIGKGKSRFLEHLIRQDIRNRQGLCLLDPHGELYDNLVRWAATHGLLARRRIHLLEPGNPDWCFGFNPLRLGDRRELSLRVDAMVNACAQVWGSEDTTQTPLLKRCLKLLFFALAVRELTLFEARHILSATDPDGLRRYLTGELGDPVFETQWRDFNALSVRQFTESFASTNNRLFDFLAAPPVRAVLGQRERVIDFRAAMDEGDIILVNLAPRSLLSFDQARLLGTLIVSELYLEARRRPAGSRPFYLYVDECYEYLTDDIEHILVQTRKFGLHAILAHQLVAHLKEAGERVHRGVMSQAQTKVVFGGLDAEEAREIGDVVFRGELDLEEPKRAFDKPVVTGYETMTLKTRARSCGVSVTDGWGSTAGTTESEATALAVDTMGTAAQETQTRVAAHGQSESRSGAVTRGESRTSGEHEALRPVLEMLPTASYSLEEQRYRAAARLMDQPAREATVRTPNRGSARIRIPAIRDGYASDARLERFRQEAFERSVFVSPISEIEAEVAERHEALRKAARHTTSPHSLISALDDYEGYLE